MRKNIINSENYLLSYPLLSIINYYCLYAIPYKLPGMMESFNFGLIIILFIVFNIFNIILSAFSWKTLKSLNYSGNSLVIIANVFFVVIAVILTVFEILLSAIISNTGGMWVN